MLLFPLELLQDPHRDEGSLIVLPFKPNEIITFHSFYMCVINKVKSVTRVADSRLLPLLRSVPLAAPCRASHILLIVLFVLFKILKQES